MPDVLAALEQHGSFRAAAAALKMPPSTFQNKVAAARAAGFAEASGLGVKSNNVELDAEGNLRKQWVGAKPAPGAVYEAPAGHVVKGESTLVDADGRIMQRWVKTGLGGGEGLIDGLRTAFAEYKGAGPVIPAPEVSDSDLLTVYPMPDLHLGMHAWGRETGQNYDLKIATDAAIRSLETLVAQSRPSKHAVLLGLGDYFHANDHKAVTPGSGHTLDVDGRWPKVFAAGAKLATAMVDIIARKHPDVEVVFLPGNHDLDAAVCLTVALSLFYSASPRIKVSTDPGIAWYRRFGACLIGATHGHTMRQDRMAMMMASDRAADWGQTVHRNMFSGHVHNETVKEIAGVRVESLQALTARDAWTSASGYRSGRSMSAITFHQEDGEIGRHRVNIAGAAR